MVEARICRDLVAGSASVTDLGTGQVTVPEDGWYEIAASSTSRDSDANTTDYNMAGNDTPTANSTKAHVANAWHASHWVLFVDGVAVAGPVPSGTVATTYLSSGQIVRPGVVATNAIMPATTGFQASNSIVGRDKQGRSRITHVSGSPSASFTGRKVG